MNIKLCDDAKKLDLLRNINDDKHDIYTMNAKLLEGDNWRFLYKSCHPQKATEQYNTK